MFCQQHREGAFLIRSRKLLDRNRRQSVEKVRKLEFSVVFVSCFRVDNIEIRTSHRTRFLHESRALSAKSNVIQRSQLVVGFSRSLCICAIIFKQILQLSFIITRRRFVISVSQLSGLL